MVRIPSTKVQAKLVDAVLGVAVFGVVAAMISANLGSDRGPEALAYGWALTLGALMLARRRYPLIVLWVTVLGLFGYYAAGYPVIGLSVPAFAALFSAAQFRKVRWPAAAAIALLAVGYGIRVLEGQDFAVLMGYELTNDVALMAAAIALGVSLRLRSRLQESSRRLIRATAERQRVQAQAAIDAERADIARELHDSLGHQGTVISMHADVAREALGVNPQKAREALEVIKQTSAAMMSELRRTVRGLQQREASREQATLASLQESLLARLPIAVDASIAVVPSLPPQVDAAAFRIVQEALTNVVRHSDAGSAALHVTTDDDALWITVRDPGPERPGEHEAGVGIHGMRERASALGGTLNVERHDGGFLVQATLPLHDDPAAVPAGAAGEPEEGS